MGFPPATEGRRIPAAGISRYMDNGDAAPSPPATPGLGPSLGLCRFWGATLLCWGWEEKGRDAHGSDHPLLFLSTSLSFDYSFSASLFSSWTWASLASKGPFHHPAAFPLGWIPAGRDWDHSPFPCVGIPAPGGGTAPRFPLHVRVEPWLRKGSISISHVTGGAWGWRWQRRAGRGLFCI